MMNKQEKIDQLNRDVDNVLKGNAPQAGTDSQRLDAARQLAAADFSAHSRARATTRARLLARANRELPIQNKRKEMNTRFSNVFRTLAFGAFLLMIVFGLGWVLSNTTPQLGVGLETPSSSLPEVSEDITGGEGEVYLVLDEDNVANPGFVRFPAACLIGDRLCQVPEEIVGLPEGSLHTTFEWSPDFSKAVAIFTYLEPQVWLFNRETHTWTQMDVPLFSNPVWSPDGTWLAGMSAAKADLTSNALLLTRADGSEWQEILTDFQGTQIPVGWVDERHFLFIQTYQDANLVVHNVLQQYEVGTGDLLLLRELIPIGNPDHESYILSGIDLSPDKTQLAYTFISVGDEPKETEVAVVNLENDEHSTVAIDGAFTNISWSPDGSRFLATTGVNVTCQVQIGNISASHFFNGDWTGSCHAIWSPDGQYVLVAPPAQDDHRVRLHMIKASDGTERLIQLPDIGIPGVAPRVSWVPAFRNFPGIVPEEPAIAFPRQPADWGSMTALMNGRLVLVDGCLRMEDAFSDTSALVVWPHDYDWQITDGIVEVLDGTGQVVARAGEEIWLGGGEAEALARLGGGDSMLAQIPEACPGPYWLSGGIAQLVTPAPIPEGAMTDFPLTLESDSETIRQRLLISYQFWQALWVDAQINDYVSGTPAIQRVQVWVNQPAQARVLSGKADGTPATLWISDGQMTRTGEDLSGYGLENFVPPMTESDTVFPHPMTGIMSTPLSSLLFPSGLAQRGGTYRPIAIETLAGRETLVVEWNRPHGPLTDRFWVDTVTGVILHQQNYGKGGDGALTYEYLISNIQYDLTFHPETFNRLTAFPPAFATGPEDIYTEVATPMPEGAPDMSLVSGEIYLVLEKSSGSEPLGFWRFPANCLVSGNPCPPLESVPGAPQEYVIQHTWSPDGTQMIYKLIYPAGQNWRFDRLTQTWSLLDIPYLWGEIWSPDSQWLLGVPAGQPENYPLVLTRADGTEWQTFMDGSSEIKTPIAWLDDHRILMTTTLDNETSEESPTLAKDLQIYDLQTGEIQTLLSKVWNPDTTFYGAFALSPDRTKVVYSIADLNGQNSEIRILTLADNTEFSFTFPAPAGPHWSPTGEWLSLTTAEGYSCGIHLIRPDGSDPHLVFTGDQSGACQHIWSPDGQTLLVPALTQTPTIPRFYVITVATGESRLVELPDVGVEFEWPVVSWVP